MNKLIDLAGLRFGILIVVEYSGEYKWLCLCDCGKEKIVRSGDLKNGSTKSCGCLKNRITHRHTKTKAYTSWAGMIQRCTNSNNTSYINYGGRDKPITVCERWLPENNGFQNFLKDMGEPPTNKHQIDRINNDLGYYKENCRWVLPKINSRNRRNNHLLKYNGKELCFAGWEEITGIPQATIRQRIKNGWSIKRALTTPVGDK